MWKRYLHTDMCWGNFRSGPWGSKDGPQEIAKVLQLLVPRCVPRTVSKNLPCGNHNHHWNSVRMHLFALATVPIS